MMIRELVARIRVALRRPTSDEPRSEALEVGDATLDTGRYQLRVGDEVFDLPRKEFEVMEMLMNHAGVVVTRDELLSDVWGITWSDSKTLDQHIRRLRRKLETTQGAPTIATIRGVGYRLEP
jgi:DNA-binding response OmpR family regulator